MKTYRSERRGATLATGSEQRIALSRQLAIRCARTAAEQLATDILVLDLTELTPIVDFFVLATGTSRRRIHTIVEEVDHIMTEAGQQRLGLEGYENAQWVLLDYGDIVVHVFEPAARTYYDLENLWADAPRIPWQEDGSSAG